MMSENRKSLNILYCLDRLHLLKSWSQFLGDAILEKKCLKSETEMTIQTNTISSTDYRLR